MDGKFNELELEFIKEALDVHGEYLDDLLADAVEARKLIKEGILHEGFSYRVGNYGINPHLEIMFPDYGRFIEINYFKKKSSNTNKWTQMNQEANRAILGLRSRKKKPRRKKDTRFYARTVYGSLNKLIGHIMYEYTDAEMERIKMILMNKNL